MGSLLEKLASGARLDARQLRSVLRQLGYQMARRRGSHEQWVRSGRTFTVACHGKEVPWYLLDALRKIAEESNDETEGTTEYHD